jgi:hypothetical protein
MPFFIQNFEYTFLPTVRTACLTSFILLDFIIVSIFGEGHQFSGTYYEIFSLVPSLLLSIIPDTFPRPLLGRAPLLIWEAKYHTHAKQQTKLQF